MTDFEIETVPFKRFWYSTVNDYIAEKLDGGTKKKGDYITDFELWKNKSYRIVPMALEAYFKYQKDPIEFIRNHDNIYDFLIMAKATGETWMEEQWEQDGSIQTRQHKKLVRYYLSKTGNELYKRGTGTTGKKMNVRTNAPNEIGDVYIHYFNQYSEDRPFVDYDQYIFRTLKMIDKLFKTKKAKQFADALKPSLQTSLF